MLSSASVSIYLNGEAMQMGKPYLLRNGDILYFSDTVSKNNHVEVVCKYYCGFDDNLRVEIKERKVRENGKDTSLLKDIDFEINKGEFVLVLGGSGA